MADDPDEDIIEDPIEVAHDDAEFTPSLRPARFYKGSGVTATLPGGFPITPLDRTSYEEPAPTEPEIGYCYTCNRQCHRDPRVKSVLVCRLCADNIMSL